MSEENSSGLDEIQASITGLHDTLGIFKQEIDSLNAKLTSIDQASTTKRYEAELQLETRLDRIQTELDEVNQLKQDFTSLQEKWDTHRSQHETHRNSIRAGLDDKIIEISRQVEAVLSLHTGFDKLTRLGKEHTHALSVVHTDLENVRQDFSGLDPRIEVLESGQQEMSYQINQTQAALEQLQSLRKILDKVERVQDDLKQNQDVLVRRLTELPQIRDTLADNSQNLTRITASVSDISTQISTLEEQFSDLSELSNQINQISNDNRQNQDLFQGFRKRLQNIEKEVGITARDLMAENLENISGFRRVIAELFGHNRMDDFLPEVKVKEPLAVINGLKMAFRELSFLDAAGSPDTAEILLKYYKISEKRDRKSLFSAYSKDIRLVLEVGQALLLEIGQRRIQVTQILTEIRNNTRNWNNETDIKSNIGISAAVELLESLKTNFGDLR